MNDLSRLYARYHPRIGQWHERGRVTDAFADPGRCVSGNRAGAIGKDRRGALARDAALDDVMTGLTFSMPPERYLWMSQVNTLMIVGCPVFRFVSSSRGRSTVVVWRGNADEAERDQAAIVTAKPRLTAFARQLGVPCGLGIFNSQPKADGDDPASLAGTRGKRKCSGKNDLWGWPRAGSAERFTQPLLSTQILTLYFRA